MVEQLINSKSIPRSGGGRKRNKLHRVQRLWNPFSWIVRWIRPLCRLCWSY